MKTIHLYLGFSFGLVFLFLGLTGAGLVYKERIQSLYQPKLDENYIDQDYLNLNQLEESLSDQFDQLEVRSLTIPHDPQGYYLFAIKYVEAGSTQYQRLWVNPTNAETAAVIQDPSILLTWIYQLHSGEILSDTGYIMVGIAGVGVLILLLTGVVSWWPGLVRIRRSLVIPAKASATVIYSRLHRISGLLLIPMFLVIVVSGVLLVFREELITPWQSKPAVESGHRQSATKPCVSSTLTNIQRTAENQFPDAYVNYIKLPRNQKRPIEVTLQHDNEVPSILGLTKVYIDTHCAAVVGTVDGRQLSLRESLLEHVLALHNGSYFGIMGRLMFVVLGFAPLIFVITGLLSWLNRRRIRS